MNNDNQSSLLLNNIRKLFSNDLFRKIFRLIRINGILKSLYFKFSAPKNGVVIKTISGVVAKFLVKNYSDLVYLTETVMGVGDERQVIEKLFSKLQPNDVFYDVGAFIGLHTIFISKKCDKVIAFEPSARSYSMLLENIKLNNAKNILPINIALGEIDGDVIMSSNDLSVYKIENNPPESIFNEKVKLAIGDKLADEQKLPIPNIIKIDVEGYEYSVIKGLENSLRDKLCRMICCEVHPTLLPEGITVDMLINLIKGYGFINIEREDRGSTFHIYCYKS
jgi:FkbM family methyltransferase